MDGGNVPDVDSRAVDLLQRQVVNRLNRIGIAVEKYVILALPDLGGTRWDDNALLIDRRAHVLR